MFYSKYGVYKKVNHPPLAYTLAATRAWHFGATIPYKFGNFPQCNCVWYSDQQSDCACAHYESLMGAPVYFLVASGSDFVCNFEVHLN